MYLQYYEYIITRTLENSHKKQGALTQAKKLWKQYQRLKDILQSVYK